MLKVIFMVLVWIRSLLAYVIMVVFGTIFFLPCLFLAAVLPEKQRYTSKVLFTLMAIVYRCAAWCSMTTIRVIGKEKIPAGPVVLIANHESALDIALLGVLMGTRPHIWYAYYIFFDLPVVGFFLRKMSIPVYLNSPVRSARAMVCGVCRAKKYGLSSLLFPEGGRYADGKIHDFFAGFAMIARKLDQPVVPVIIRNAGKVYPPHSFLFYPGSIDIEIGDPLTVNEEETNAQFACRAREWFVQRNTMTP